jgi:arabinofuranosyltransferase
MPSRIEPGKTSVLSSVFTSCWFPLLAPAVLVAVLLVNSLNVWNFTVDDSYISCRYAENLAEGRGLVFNPGERVEGYSNFLWVVILGIFARMGFEPLLTGKVVGLVFSAATLVLLWETCVRLNNGRRNPVTCVAPLLCATSSVYATWSVGGLETPLFSFLLVFSFLLYLHESGGSRFPKSGLFLALVALTRPEGALFALLLFGAGRLLRIMDGQGLRPSSTECFRVAIFLSVFGAFLAWRVWYYGDILPNTVYAKTGGGLNQVRSGIAYVSEFFWGSGILFLAFLPAIALRVCKDRGDLLMIAVLCLGYTGFIVATGGDWMPQHRFFAPVLPWLLLLAQEGFRSLLAMPAISKWSRLFVAAALVCFLTYQLFQSMAFQKDLRSEHDGEFFRAIEWLQKNAPPGATIALQAAGAIPYYTGLSTIDRMGLLDPHISRLPGGRHEKQDERYVLGKTPTFIQLFARNDPRDFPYDSEFIGDRILWSMPEFHRDYELVLMCSNPSSPRANRYLLLYKKM